jgi:hypothetical protein
VGATPPEGAGTAGTGAGDETPGAEAAGAGAAAGGAAASAARRSASALSEYGNLVPRGVLRVLGGSADADAGAGGAPAPGVTAGPGVPDADAGARGSSGRDSMPRDSTEPLRIGAVWTVASGTG